MIGKEWLQFMAKMPIEEERLNYKDDMMIKEDQDIIETLMLMDHLTTLLKEIWINIRRNSRKFTTLLKRTILDMSYIM